MIIVCDVDGVILNIAKYFTSWYNKKYNGNLSDNPECWRFGFSKPDSHKYFDEFFKEGGPHIYDYLYSDTEEYFNKIAKEHEVWIVTSFPAEYADDRRENLKNLNYERLIFAPDKENIIIKEIKPDACIEDKPELLGLYVDNDIETFFPGDRNYIKRETDNYGTPFHSWEELYNLIY